MNTTLTVDGTKVTISLTDDQIKDIERQQKRNKLSVCERVDSYESALEDQGIEDKRPYPNTKDADEDWLNACHELKVVNKSLLEGKELNWDDTNEAKYYPVFDMRGGFSFDCTNSVHWRAPARTAARLCVDTSAKANHFGTSPKLFSIWKRFHGHKK